MTEKTTPPKKPMPTTIQALVRAVLDGELTESDDLGLACNLIELRIKSEALHVAASSYIPPETEHDVCRFRIRERAEGFTDRAVSGRG